MNGYVTLTDESAELVINKSRFIAFSFRIENEADAAAHIKSLRKTYRDATHVCYAYALKDGCVRRSSDDGEPAGTAGMPILEVINGGALSDVLIAVVRYFGGVKLGAGGLVRAYTQSAQAVVAAAKKLKYVEMSVFAIELDYSDYNVYAERFAANGFHILDIGYKDKVSLTVATEDSEKFAEFVSRITKGSAPGFIEERFIASKG